MTAFVPVRRLLAVLTLTCALQPVLAMLAGTRTGSACAHRHGIGCQAVLTHALVARVAPAIGAGLIALALAVLADGLRQGRRFAWCATLVGCAAWATVAATALASPTAGRPSPLAVGLTLQPVALVVVLLRCRAAFGVRAPAGTYRRVLGAALAVLTLLWGLRAVVGLVTGQPGPDPVTVLLRTAPGTVFWLAVLAALPATFRRHGRAADSGDRQRARRLLERGGGGVLSFMSTWRGNRYWFTDDGRAAVAYRLVGSVALTVGDPFGERAAVRNAVRGFTDFCAVNGFTACLYSISEELAANLPGTGWRLMQVAQDARVPLPNLRLTGRRWQDVRTALNRARREGIVAEWTAFRHAPPPVARQIRAISAAWLADRRAPEMTFTLGGIDELRDGAVRCLVAADARGRIHAVTSWLPVYRDGAVVGWTLDMMRRRPDAANGTTEFLIASAALDFQREGAEFVSLSGTPLAHTGRPLEMIGRLVEPVYGFRTLLAFKAKFQPVYQPLYLAYPRATALPAIAVAVARAYLPGLTVTRALRLAVSAVRARRLREPAHHDHAVPAAQSTTGEMSWVPGR